MEHDELRQLVEEMAITVESVFVPYSVAKGWPGRAAGWKGPNLNAECSVKVKGRTAVQVRYTASSGHCRTKIKGNPRTVFNAEGIEKECETGYPQGDMGYRWVPEKSKGKWNPDPLDVLHCIVMDAGAIDYPTYEDWAGEYGFDPDSRRGLESYQECVRNGLALRAALDEGGLEKLPRVFQDY